MSVEAISQTTHQHHTCNIPSTNSKISKVITTICRVAIGVFAAIVAPKLFACTFAIGLAWGIYQAYKNPEVEHKHMVPAGCSQAFLEHLAGVHFSEEMTLAIGAAITITHIEHHPEVFVSLVGVALGHYVGKQGYLMWYQGRNIEAHA